MYEANVRGAERVLDAAIEAGAQKIVYVSTVNAFGNTHGKVVDESYRRPEGDRFLSYYDETKFLAHRVAEERIGRGAPVLIAMPGGVYGPGDPSVLGAMIEQVRTGKLRFVTFPDAGFNLVYVEDAAAGILLVHDRGKVGESYVLGGEITTMGDGIRRVAEMSGRKPPRMTMPAWLVKASIPFAPIVTRMMGQPPNLRELISAADKVTYWATDAKARRKLGYAPRDLEAGLTELLAAA
jgi:nucleoside-diphosphate-sugar epimerase